MEPIERELRGKDAIRYLFYGSEISIQNEGFVSNQKVDILFTVTFSAGCST